MDHDTLTEPVSLGYERCQLKGIAFEHKQQQCIGAQCGLYIVIRLQRCRYREPVS